MATRQWAVVFRHVHRLFQGGSVSGLTEGQLLDRFVSTRDEVAFEAILARHGSMVLGVCRGVLDDPHDVEDAFQATFLVLVKKAGKLRESDLLGQWLYGVARRVSLRARSDSSRRKARERPKSEEPSAEFAATLDHELRELQVLIREEVDRLTTDDRMAVVLCYLEGLTHEEAADRLGWPVGTVKGRLSRARDKLRIRLTRRGVALPTFAIASTLAKMTSATVPPELIRSTTLAATQLATGRTLVAGIVSGHAITLMEGAIGTMYATKIKIVAGSLVAGLVIAVPGVLAYQGQGAADPAAKPRAPASPRPSDPPAAEGRATGTDGLTKADSERDQLVQLAEEGLVKARQAMLAGPKPGQAIHLRMEPIPVWSRRLVEAKIRPDSTEAVRKAALRAHRDRMKDLVDLINELVKGEASGATELDVLEAKFHLIEAQRWFNEGSLRALTDAPPKADESERADWAAFSKARLARKPNPADDQQTKAILEKLELKISMTLGDDMPLEEVKRYIEVSTQDEAAGLASGIPIYVDPVGLQLAGKTMASTVSLRLENVPLRTTLGLILRQLGLTYFVRDGLLTITNEDVPGMKKGSR